LALNIVLLAHEGSFRFDDDDPIADFR